MFLVYDENDDSPEVALYTTLTGRDGFPRHGRSGSGSGS
jgi:hypothetical protein